MNFLTTLTVGALAATSLVTANAGAKKVDSNDPVKDLITAFCNLDFNGDGVLDYGEFTAVMRGTPGALQRLFRSVDQNRNKAVSISEYARYQGVRVPKSINPPVDADKQEFRRIDADGNADGNADGVLALEEIALSTTFPDGASLEAFFEFLDTDDSGSLDLDEFRRRAEAPILIVCWPDLLGDLSRFIGLTLEEAEVQAGLEGRPTRVIGADGEWYPVTTDYNEARINFYLEKGLVSRATAG